MRFSDNRPLAARSGQTASAICLALVATACGTGRPAIRPDDMSAAQHRDAASRESELACRIATAQLSQATRRSSPACRDPRTDYVRTAPLDNLPAGPLAEAEKHRALARRHAAVARYLEENESAECRGLATAERAECPLLGAVDRVEDVAGGVRLHFSAGTWIEGTVSRMRCHQAYARARALQIDDACPLYARRVDIRSGRDPLAVEITTADPTRVAEVRRLSREDAGFAPPVGPPPAERRQPGP